MARSKQGATARRMSACTAGDASHLRKMNIPTWTIGKNSTYSERLGPFPLCTVLKNKKRRRYFCFYRRLRLSAQVSRSISPTWRKKKERTLSACLDMHDSSAWLQPAWTIQCWTQWLCNPPWLTGKETLATGTTTQFSWGQEVNPPQLGPGRKGGGHALHMNNFLNEHYLNWWLVS